MSTTISGTNGVTFPDSTSMQTGQQACKAWVNFNGTGTVAIRGSYNVSSITDVGTGVYGVNFVNAMPDTNYATSLNIGNNTNQTWCDNFSTTYVLARVYTGSAYVDDPIVQVAVFSN